MRRHDSKPSKQDAGSNLEGSTNVRTDGEGEADDRADGEDDDWELVGGGPVAPPLPTYMGLCIRQPNSRVAGRQQLVFV